MSLGSGTSIIISDEYWMHIRHTRIYHCRYPEIRAEGESLAEAGRLLVSRLTLALEFVHGRDREAVERAVADVRTFRASQSRTPSEAVASGR